MPLPLNPSPPQTQFPGSGAGPPRKPALGRSSSSDSGVKVRWDLDGQASRDNYTFTEGRLEGFSAGVSTRYVQGKPLTEVAMASAVVLPATDKKDWIVTNPFFSYRRKFGRLNWKLQLNINHVFGVKEEEGNHSYWVRSTDPRPYVTTATVEF